MSGTSPDGRLVEVVEIPNHPFFIASQYHPEFKSRPDRPAPLFREFVGCALERAQATRGGEEPALRDEEQAEHAVASSESPAPNP
jgi:CTP synthase